MGYSKSLSPEKQQEIMAYASLMGYIFHNASRPYDTEAWWAIVPEVPIEVWVNLRTYRASIIHPQPLDSLLDKIGTHHGLL